MKAKILFVLGLLLTATYWYSVKPVGGYPGYAEDMCFIDMGRHMMAQEIQASGHPKFNTQHFMAPEGMSVPYLSWSPESHWIGAKFWDWSREFPFQWAFFGFSLLATFLGVGFILLRMGLPAAWVWAITTAVVIFHVPRHFKIWHHYEHLPEHWIYFCLFLDAWLWQRFYRDRVWSRKLELWRVVLGLGTLGSAGYFWGALILEWVVVRASIVILAVRRRKAGIETKLEPISGLQAALPLGLIAVFCVLWARWYLPLFAEVKSGGEVSQGLSWFANFAFVIRPLWLEFFYTPAHPLDTPETVVTIGWFYWIPFIAAIWFLRKKKRGPGIGVAAPFLIYLAIALLYACLNHPLIVQQLVRALIPFMKFFRVASRWGLFLPQIVTVIIVLAWPELSRAWVSVWSAPKKRPFVIAGVFVFAVMSVAEASKLLTPVNMMPALPGETVQMLEKIRQTPGTAVLDLPFCVAGGNGVCTDQQCPNYPAATIGVCMRNWHDKDVYGLYSARMVPANCENYNRSPYWSWFNAWRAQRCFNSADWEQFCSYLNQHTELSAILLYPEIWFGAASPDCQAEFRRHLGGPLGEASALTAPTRGGQGANLTRIQWFAPHCIP
ncbi:MAG: hypothetical protein P4M08_07120 [Oligoflexia bacterium]|nr:hypothetical protein [Oligoflexia bacterium]